MITIRPQTPVEISARLSVKELADVLGVTVGYVYKMRMAGFPMVRTPGGIYEATAEAARAWIKASKFRIVQGRPVAG